jgi:hypothetical protein
MLSREEWDRDERGLFDSCKTATELYVAVHAVLGLDAARELAEKGGQYRAKLRAIADEAKAVGLIQLAQTLRQVARCAPPKPAKMSAREHYMMQRYRSASNKI